MSSLDALTELRLNAGTDSSPGRRRVRHRAAARSRAHRSRVILGTAPRRRSLEARNSRARRRARSRRPLRSRRRRTSRRSAPISAAEHRADRRTPCAPAARAGSPGLARNRRNRSSMSSFSASWRSLSVEPLERVLVALVQQEQIAVGQHLVDEPSSRRGHGRPRCASSPSVSSCRAARGRARAAAGAARGGCPPCARSGSRARPW